MIRSLAIAAATTAALVAQQRTLVVDQATGPFAQISDAIAAAQPGDRIEVHPGTYASFTVTFGLDIVAPSGGAFVQGSGFDIVRISILNVPAQHAVRLDGLELHGHPFFGQWAAAALAISGCAGIVHLHRFTTSECRSTIDSSARIGISNCTFGGMSGDQATFNPIFTPSAGLLLVNSSAVLGSCSLIGGGGR